MALWRKLREGKTGMAMKGCFSRISETLYEESDISAQSNSWLRSMRKKVSSTGRFR